MYREKWQKFLHLYTLTAAWEHHLQIVLWFRYFLVYNKICLYFCWFCVRTGLCFLVTQCATSPLLFKRCNWKMNKFTTNPRLDLLYNLVFTPLSGGRDLLFLLNLLAPATCFCSHSCSDYFYIFAECILALGNLPCIFGGLFSVSLTKSKMAAKILCHSLEPELLHGFICFMAGVVVTV